MLGPWAVERYWFGGTITDLTFSEYGVLAEIKSGNSFTEKELSGLKAIYAKMRIYLIFSIFLFVMLLGRGLTGPKGQSWIRSAFSRD